MQQNKFVTSLNLSYLIRRRHISKMPRFQSKSHAVITRDQPKIAPMSYHKTKFQNGGKSGKNGIYRRKRWISSQFKRIK